MHNCYSNHAYMHGYCNASIYFFISFFLSPSLCVSPFLCVSGCSRSHSHLSLTAPDQQRTPHIHQQRAPHQKISSKIKYYTRFVWLPRKTQRKQEIKKINQTQRKSTDIWLLIVFPSISTLFHHFLTNQTRNKEN